MLRSCGISCCWSEMLGPSCQPPVSMALAGLNCLRAPVTFQMYSQSTQHAQKVLEDWKGESEWVFLCPMGKQVKNQEFE